MVNAGSACPGVRLGNAAPSVRSGHGCAIGVFEGKQPSATGHDQFVEGLPTGTTARLTGAAVTGIGESGDNVASR